MIRFVVCVLIVLTTTSFQFNTTRQNEAANLLSKIGEARGLLEEERVQILKGTIGSRRIRTGRRSFMDVPITGIVGREMVLAVMGSDGEIRTVRGIKRDAGFDVLTSGFII